MLGPAGVLVSIEPGVDYLDFKDTHSTIFTLHCIRTNECPVIVTTIGNSTIEFPSHSFICGACYHIYIRKMEFDKEKAGFVGYRLLQR